MRLRGRARWSTLLPSSWSWNPHGAFPWASRPGHPTSQTTQEVTGRALQSVVVLLHVEVLSLSVKAELCKPYHQRRFRPGLWACTRHRSEPRVQQCGAIHCCRTSASHWDAKVEIAQERALRAAAVACLSQRFHGVCACLLVAFWGYNVVWDNWVDRRHRSQPRVQHQEVGRVGQMYLLG